MSEIVGKPHLPRSDCQNRLSVAGPTRQQVARLMGTGQIFDRRGNLNIGVA